MRAKARHPPGLPPEVPAERTEILDRATAELVGALTLRGVPSVLLKGPVLSSWLYDDGVPRGYNDIDLLVDLGDRPRAAETLLELGFTREPTGRREWQTPAHDMGWVRTAPVVEVDLHWTLWSAQAAPATVWRELRVDAQELRVGGADVLGLGPRGRAMLVAMHAARHHGPRHPVLRAKTVEDLQRALQRCSLDDWRAAAELADRLGLLDAFAVGLRSVPAGKPVAARLRLPDGARAMILLSGTAPPTADWFLHVLQARGARAKLRLLAGEIVPSVEFMRLASPRLANHGRVGLLTAYAIRPLIRAWRAPRGFVAARRAARAAARTADAPVANGR